MSHLGLWIANEPYWSLYHKVTFDGINRRIIINPEVTEIDVETDLYSDWKEWSLIYDNLKFLPALRTTGGDPLPGGRRVGQYFFLTNGWKLIAPTDYLASDIQIDGNLFTEDGSDVFAAGENPYRLIRQVVSQFTEIASPTINTDDISIVVSGSGLTQEESAKLDALVSMNASQTASLSLLLATSSLQTITLSDIQQLQNITSSSLNDIDINVTSTLVSQSMSYLQLIEQSASLYEQTQVLQEQSASISLINAKTDIILQNTSGSGSLTPEQSMMLLEMYNLLGLDPTKPLIVTPTSRDAGDISQTIDKTGDTVTVIRVP